MNNAVSTLLAEIVAAGKARGLTQQVIVQQAGLGASTLSKAKQAGDLRVSTLERMANVVGLRLSLVPNEPRLEKLLDRSLFDANGS